MITKEEQLRFIGICVKKGVSSDDLGVLVRWYFAESEDFQATVQWAISTKFFDTTTKVEQALTDFYFKEE